MANLFGKNKLKSVAQAIDTDDVIVFIDIVKKWHHDYHHGTLKQDKETSREQEYNQNFFKDILGYKEKPAVPFNFEPKATTEKGQLPDAVIGYTDKTNDIKNISAVVELKGAAIDLDRPQQREGNMSPVQQAFKYKTQYRNCPFVIVSNFWEFRLYRDNLLDYEAWTLDDLVNPESDYLLFKTWYVLLKSDNFITSKGTSKTENILSDIRIEQENISKKFYKVYKEARLVLLRDIYSRNETVRENIDMGVEKAQKIIDRIVFTCFAEDRGLLPDNTLQRVIRDAEQSSFGVSLWQAFKGLFEAIDSGSDKLEIPDGYNGGLFKHDEVLNNLRISDEGLKPVVELSKYDFSEDLSVSILGHIFEQSISDLEEIKNKVNVDKNIEAIITQSRRKKDGIFYTPDYIVRYIVDNSLGTYLREHEEVFKEEYKLHGDINDKNYSKREKQAYQKYQYFLQNVKVVDPACGSGAFLVYVFDYLMSENQRVGDILGNNIFSTDEYIRDILKNNIYGVDLNEESVEITKLSLWLKSAQKGKKLTSLDNNIKCGNSLIDDPVVAGSKAFNWQKQFSDVFKNGGFDIVVGNPPYVKLQSINSSDATQTGYFEQNYSVAKGRFDLYVLFIEKALSIIQEHGIASYILPHKFLGSEFGSAIRKYLADKNAVERIVHFGSHKVFADASTYTCIILLSKNNKKLQFARVDPLDIQSSIKFSSIDYRELNENMWQLLDDSSVSIINKVTEQKNKLNNVFSRVSRGVVTGADSIFIVKGNIVGGYFVGQSKELGGEIKLEHNLVKPLLMGSSVSRYSCNTKDTFLIYPHELINGKTTPINEEKLRTEYPQTYSYLLKFKDLLVAKKIKYKTNPTYWYSLHNSREIEVFENRKIITPYLANYTNMTVESGEAYTNDKNTNLVFRKSDFREQDALFAILNSKLIWYYIAATGSEFSGGYFAFTNIYLEPITFPDVSKYKDDLSDRVQSQFESKRKLLQVNKRFCNIMHNEFGRSILDRWYLADFNSLVSSLKIHLSISQKDELIQLFEKYHTELQQLDIQIQKTDQEIDQIVYEIYDLSAEDIAKVEEINR
jgi:hypothetical protein